MSPCDSNFQRLIYSFGIGSVLGNSCLNPDTQFPNTSSVNAKKKDVCDNFRGIAFFNRFKHMIPYHVILIWFNFKDGRYCYAKCLDKYYPPPNYETKEGFDISESYLEVQDLNTQIEHSIIEPKFIIRFRKCKTLKRAQK